MFSRSQADYEEGAASKRHRPVGRGLLAIGAAIGLTACDLAHSQTSAENAVTSDAAVPSFGKWSVYSETDPMTDKKIIAIRLAAENDGGGSDVLLSVYCSKFNGWSTVRWNKFLGGEREGGVEMKEVTYRLGNAQPVVVEWPVLENRSTTRIADAPKFITQVRETEKLVLRIEPYQELAVTAVFDTKGLKAALLANSPECDWYVRDIRWAEYQAKQKAQAGKTGLQQ
ncbi:hypothetical protein [Rhizobium sp. Nf11,1]|uniref:hypothetical protein n=1 Tax=Rhizobium sp. Nf11,1 TaxID=3404923 RepID=UPI003D327C25